MDTGNELKDPVTQKPVMVVEYAALQNIFPKAFSRLYEKYAAVDVVKHSETETVSDAAIEQVPAAIVSANSTEGIDTVSGATITSKAIIAAVEDALSKIK